MAPKISKMSLPPWLPDPDTATEIVGLPAIVEKMLTEIKSALGADFSTRKPLEISEKGGGWSAPFDVKLAVTALSREKAYQSAINVFILKMLCLDDQSINYRNVKYLADHYFKATPALNEAGSFRIGHFPHTLHAVVRDAKEIETPWTWCVFEKFVGAEILLAFCFSLCLAIHRKPVKEKKEDYYAPWIHTALTTQCKFHVHRDRAETISAKMQFTEHLSADFKALGFSALQESEHIITIIDLIKHGRPGEARVQNSEIAAKINVHRAADTGKLAGVSEADADDNSTPAKKKGKADDAARMLEISIKLARVLMKYPALRVKLRLLEQRWGRECLCDSPAKLEKIVQMCGGADSVQLGENMDLVLNGVSILLKRGGIPGGPGKVTIPLLEGKTGTALGLVHRFLKRHAIARMMIEKFPMPDEQQQVTVNKFASYEAYDAACPPAGGNGSLDLTWMSTRTPACAALTNFLRSLWEDEFNEAIKGALKAAPSATCPLDLINAVEDLKTPYAKVDAEFQLMKKAAAEEAARPGGVSVPGRVGHTTDPDSPPEDPALVRLKNVAGLRRAEVISLQIAATSVTELKKQGLSSTADSVRGKFGKQHIAIIGDFAVLPDCGTRP